MRPDGYCTLLGAEALPRHAGVPLAHHAAGAHGAYEEFARVALASGPRCEVLRLPAGSGLVLGTLFDRSGKRVDTVSLDTAAGWVATRGRALIERYWGAWLAILSGPETTLMVRDPSGLLPCYYSERDGRILAASDLAWAGIAGADQRSVCWDEIHAQLQYASLRTARTAITGMSELLPGAVLRIEPAGSTVEQLWTPHRFVQGWDPPMPFDEAADRLRRTVDLTISAWAKQFARPLVSLSGGLDSSIVAAACAPHSASLQAVTWRGSDADLDETRYAQAVADHLGIAWRCDRLDRTLIDLRISAAQDLPRPSARSFSQANDQQDRQLAEALGCDAFFVGAGGDSIFWYFNTAAPALDRLRIEGMRGLLRTIGDLADMCGVPWTQAFWIVLRKYLQRRSPGWPNETSFLSPHARRPAEIPYHPWWPGPSDTLPGVRAYVVALIQLSDHHEYHARADYAPVIAPLASQPIVEACLGMPSWLSAAGGANRAVARAAFADTLPASIIARRTKGGFDGFVHDLLERNRPVAREMLLGGALARGNWLDISAIAAALDSHAPIASAQALRLLRLTAIEAWLAAIQQR